MTGPTVGQLMSERDPDLRYEDDDEEDDDDFLPRRRRISDSDQEDTPAAKRTRYSPSAPNGYAQPSPPALVSPSQPHPPPQTYIPPPRPSLGAKPPLEHSILNIEPFDEFIREVGDFVHRLVANRTENVEVEAKIGVLRDNASGQRIRLPVGVETSLNQTCPSYVLGGPHMPRFGVYSSSNDFRQNQHRHYNTLLNNLGAEPQPSEGPRTPVKYLHTHRVDTLFPAPDGSRDRIRVTVDEPTGKVIECIRKVRLGDLNVYSPKRNADWRISVNLEIPSPEPKGTPVSTRKKDRLTYTHQYCNIDLTQVKQFAAQNSAPTVLHELELELNSSAMPVLLHAATRRGSADPSLTNEQRDEFDDIIRIFVNNARILIRNASTGWEGF